MTCGTCTNWQLKANPSMAKLGFARCVQGDSWRYWPPTHACERFKPAEAKTVEQREKFLRKLQA